MIKYGDKVCLKQNEKCVGVVRTNIQDGEVTVDWKKEAKQSCNKIARVEWLKKIK